MSDAKLFADQQEMARLINDQQAKIADLERQVEALKGGQEWISVDERLPDAGSLVWVEGKPFSNKPRMTALAVYSGRNEWEEPGTLFGWFDGPDSDGYYDSGFNDMDNIDQWKLCTLPTPPKEPGQ